jgi:hypothetical protein
MNHVPVPKKKRKKINVKTLLYKQFKKTKGFFKKVKVKHPIDLFN